jgi:hypothetical protein
MSTEQARLRWRLGNGVRTPALILMVAVAATATVSCADSPLDLMHGEALVEAQVQAEANHTWRAGASPTWHGYHAPAVTASLGESSVALCAAWADDFLFTRDGGKYAATDVFRFDLSWKTGGANWMSASVRNDPGSQEGCVVVDAAEGDLVEYTVKGMARFGTGRMSSTHHTLAKYGELVVSGGSGDPDDDGPSTPGDPLEGARILYFTDFVLGTDHILGGLQALAAEGLLQLTVAASRSDLMERLADNPPDAVIHFNQNTSLTNAAWTQLAEWVGAGNRLILADHQLNATILAALEATGLSTGNGGGLVFTDERLKDGVAQPMQLSPGRWFNYALPLAPMGEGKSVCAFGDGEGSSCMVLGNDGRTAAVGFLADVVEESDAHALIRNLLRVVLGS